jgi:hypothetical protein
MAIALKHVQRKQFIRILRAGEKVLDLATARQLAAST